MISYSAPLTREEKIMVVKRIVFAVLVLGTLAGIIRLLFHVSTIFIEGFVVAFPILAIVFIVQFFRTRY